MKNKTKKFKHGLGTQFFAFLTGTVLLLLPLHLAVGADNDTASEEIINASADTTLQAWQNEKTQSMAAKPYLGALRPINQGSFGEKFESADPNDSTDAKMGMLTFDLSSYDIAPKQAVVELTYLGSRGNPNPQAKTSIIMTAVDDTRCTNNAASCATQNATWASRPKFDASTADTLTARSAEFAFGQTAYSGDEITINPANTTKVRVDVSEIIRAQFAANKKVVTLVFSENTGTEVRFASTEGANGGLSGATTQMSPKMLITPTPKAYTLQIAEPEKTRYQLAENFDPAGLIVKSIATADGSEQILDTSQYTIDTSAFDANNIGIYPIKVVLKSDPSIYASFNVSVIAPNAALETENIANDDLLSYLQPASETELGNIGNGNNITGDNNIWQRTTLPIGNGKIGGTVWGEIAKERVTFNEETLWTGGPGNGSYQGGNNADKGQYGKTLRDLNKELETGKQTVNPAKLTGGEDQFQQGAYQNWGNLYIDYGFGANPKVSEYQRNLNLSKGKAEVAFVYDGVRYTREFFVSNPDNVMLARLDADQKLNLQVSLPTNLGFSKANEKVEVIGDTLHISGQMARNKLQYNAQIKAVLDNGVGEISQGAQGTLKISDADGVTLYISAATDYKGEYPNYRTGESADELNARVKAAVQNAANLGYAKVKQKHLTDHGSFYNRVKLDLGQSEKKDSLPTDKLLQLYKSGNASEEQKRQLEVLVYQYGRYLTIASSRENSQLPSNLQGIWSSTAGDGSRGTTPWASDFHMNVNLQMNYWPTYSANLGELAQPLINYVKALVEPGRVTADVYAGAKTARGTAIGAGNGFMAHTENTAYGWTAPGDTFSWGWSPAAVPWILQNVYEAWEYLGDREQLREDIYPLLREEANFYVNSMLHQSGQKASDGTARLTTGVAYSPEHGPMGTDGNTYESSLVWQLLNDAVEAAQVLEVDQDLIGDTAQCAVANWDKDQNGTFIKLNANRSWICAKSLLKPIEVGDSGQIKEWFFEGELGKTNSGAPIGNGYETKHRHLSHLLGLFPGDLISVDHAQYLEAAKVSLINRGDDATGWGVGQRINAWARTGDGDHAYQLVEKQLQNAMYPNLFDAHPPFQIDGNFGNTSGVNEMLLQSNSTFTDVDGNEYRNYTNLLPALPKVWASGSVQGLIARGNISVGMDWKDGKLTQAALTAANEMPIAVKVSAGEAKNYKVISEDQLVAFEIVKNSAKESLLTFSAQAGKTYLIVLNTPEPLISAQVQPIAPSTNLMPSTSDPVNCTIAPYVQIPESDLVGYWVSVNSAPAILASPGKVTYPYGAKIEVEARLTALGAKSYQLTGINTWVYAAPEQSPKCFAAADDPIRTANVSDQLVHRGDSRLSQSGSAALILCTLALFFGLCGFVLIRKHDLEVKLQAENN